MNVIRLSVRHNKISKAIQVISNTECSGLLRYLVQYSRMGCAHTPSRFWLDCFVAIAPRKDGLYVIASVAKQSRELRQLVFC